MLKTDDPREDIYAIYDIQVGASLSPWGVVAHVKIRRSDGQPVMLNWDDMQVIKDVALGPHSTAIEIFPPADEVVNEANIRHLWEVPIDMQIPSLYRRM